MRQNIGPVLVGLVLFVIGAGLGVVAVTQGWFGLPGAAGNAAEQAKKPAGSELETLFSLLAKTKEGNSPKKLPSDDPMGKSSEPAEKLQLAAPIKKVAIVPFLITNLPNSDDKEKAACKAEAESFHKNLRKLLTANVGLTIIEVADTEAPKEKKDFLEFGEKLGVDAIVSGQLDFSYKKPNSVTASLYEVKTATYLWSNRLTWDANKGLNDLENFHQIPGLITQELKQKLPANKQP